MPKQAAAFFRQLFFVAFRAELVLAREVAMHGAHREGGRDGDVGQAEVGERAAHEFAARGAVGDALAHVEVQHGAAGVFGLPTV